MPRKRKLPPKTGDCYQAAIEYLLSKALCDEQPENFKLVHGEVAGRGPLEGLTFGHAWIENNDTVIDTSNGNHVVMPKVLYYCLGCITQINNFHIYSWDEVRKKVVENKTYGPWDLKTASGY